MKPQAFIDALSAAAVATAKTSGVPASFTIAQAALESAWGKSQLATDAFNLFGVKADKSWTGPTFSLPTEEVESGVRVKVQAKWRRYRDWHECMDDHAKFLIENRRYRAAFEHKDGASFAAAVAAAGYATDPLYCDKLVAVIRSHNLQSLDAQVTA